MSNNPTLIALDWGTSNLRASLLGPGGAVRDRRSAAGGVMAVPERRFEAALRSLCGDWIDAHRGPLLASGMIGSEMVARSAPDGHTVLVGITTHIQNSAIFAKVPYDPLKDFEPVSQICLSYLVLVVKPDFPAGNLKDFIALVKANPGKYSFGSFGTGSGQAIPLEEYEFGGYTN